MHAMIFHHDIIIFVKSSITGTNSQNLSQNGQRVGEIEQKEDARPDRLGETRISTRELPELNLLVLANALSVLTQILEVWSLDATFYEYDDVMVKSHCVHENSGV